MYSKFDALSAFFVMIAMMVFFSFLMSWPVYMLWNHALVGAVDGIHEVSWLQAWGISMLCSFLFKSSSVKKKS
jgi:hypothetical protein